MATITGEAEDPYLARLAALAPWERYVIELYADLVLVVLIQGPSSQLTASLSEAHTRVDSSRRRGASYRFDIAFRTRRRRRRRFRNKHPRMIHQSVHHGARLCAVATLYADC